MSRIILHFFPIFFLFCGWNLSAQQWQLHIEGKNANQTKSIDSLSYSKRHNNLKEVSDEANRVLIQLQSSGYLSAQISDHQKQNDSVYRYEFDLKNKTNFIHIYIGKNSAHLKPDSSAVNDSLKIQFSQVSNFLNQQLKYLENEGYSLAQLQLRNTRFIKNKLHADLWLEIGQKRKLQDIVFEGYDKFPEGHKRALKRQYKNQTFNQETLQKLYKDINQFGFVQQIKYPEILFTTDTTKVYVYLEKAKANRFDGLVGFTNDDQNSKIVFSGYLDIQLTNLINSGEVFQMYWKSDGQQQRTFNAAIDLPYIFKSRFGVQAGLQIFKQDSTFQNTKTNIELGYLFKYNLRAYLGYQSTESSDIQNQNSASINDFKNKFYTLGLRYHVLNPDQLLFPEKTSIQFKVGTGDRSGFTENNQLFAEADLSHQLFLNPRNSIQFRSLSYYLKSDAYAINELYRFGGINSIRGFNENSLQANILTSILSEYRYQLSSNLFVHSIIDYAYFKDDATKINDRLLGLGLGFGILTKTGLLRLVYANGSTKDSSIKLSNSIVHLSLKATF